MDFAIIAVRIVTLGSGEASEARLVSVRFSRDLLVRTLLRFISAGPMAKGW